MATGYKQDLPPKGGYSPFEWAKKPVKGVNGYVLGGSILVFNIFGTWWMLNKRSRIRYMEREVQDARLANEPFFWAEKDRAIMRCLRANYEEERELMKNVPGWEVGKWEGEPVFYNPRDRWAPPRVMELYAHAPRREAKYRTGKRNNPDNTPCKKIETVKS